MFVFHICFCKIFFALFLDRTLAKCWKNPDFKFYKFYLQLTRSARAPSLSSCDAKRIKGTHFHSQVINSNQTNRPVNRTERGSARKQETVFPLSLQNNVQDQILVISDSRRSGKPNCNYQFVCALVTLWAAVIGGLAWLRPDLSNTLKIASAVSFQRQEKWRSNKNTVLMAVTEQHCMTCSY